MDRLESIRIELNAIRGSQERLWAKRDLINERLEELRQRREHLLNEELAELREKLNASD